MTDKPCEAPESQCIECGCCCDPICMTCPECGYPIQDAPGEVEREESVDFYLPPVDEELEHYYSQLCSMCGKEGASPRGKKGELFCSSCWMIWTS
jgi:hypothetical protein